MSDSKASDGSEAVEIIAGLYLGDKYAAKDREALQRLGVSYIVNCTEPLSGGGVHNYYEGEGLFKYMRCPVQDSDGAQLAPFFESTASFIDEALTAGYGVLVHCQMGVSRSPTIVISYLLQRRNMSLNEAYALVRSRRPEAKPKANFLRQLLALESELHGGGAKAQKRKASDDADRKDTDTQDKDTTKTDSTATETESNSGVKQRRVVGPTMPPAAGDDKKTEAEGNSTRQIRGPALPPHLNPAGTQSSGDGKKDTVESAPERRTYGMELPPHLRG